MTTTERQQISYQVAADNIQCRADLLECQAYEVDVRGWCPYEDIIDTFKVVVAAMSSSDARWFALHVDLDEAYQLSRLPFKTV